MLNLKGLFDFALKYLKDPILYQFAVVGLLAAAFTLAFTGIFTTFLGIQSYISVFLAWELTVIWSFIIFEHWTFSKINKKHRKMIRFMIFHLVTAGALLTNETVLIVLTTKFQMYYLVAEFFGILAGFLVNYNLNRKFSWSIKSAFG